MAKKVGGQYLLKKAEKGLQSIADEVRAKRDKRRAAEAAAKEPEGYSGIGHNQGPPMTTPKQDKPLTKAQQTMLAEQAKLDAATARVEEAFKPYEGATPNVPQHQFQRSATGKQQIDPVIQAAMNSPTVRQAMLQAAERGMSLKDWYNMEQTRLMFGDVLRNQNLGDTRFNRLQDYMGSTSPLTKVDANIKNASRWNYYDANQLPPEEQLTSYIDPETGKVKEKLDPAPPEGYGGPGQINQFKMSMPLLSGEVSELDPEEYLKTSRYTGQLKGNVANAAMDRHAVRGPLMHLGEPEGLSTSVKLGKGQPAFNAQQMFNELSQEGVELGDLPPTWWKDVPKNAAEYYALEDWYRGMGQELGLPVGQIQPTTWVGNAAMTGVETDPTMTAQQLLNQRVAKTAIERNMDPRDVLTMLMRSAGYLSLGGVGLGAAEEFMPGRFEEEQPL